MFRVLRRQIGGVVILDAVGMLRAGEPETALLHCVDELTRLGFRNIILNLSKARGRNSAAISALLAAADDVRNALGDLKLLHVDTFSSDLMIGTILQTHFDVFDSEDAALESFARRADMDSGAADRRLFGATAALA
jgi:anti-anti-sigma regulatory factor